MNDYSGAVPEVRRRNPGIGELEEPPDSTWEAVRDFNAVLRREFAIDDDGITPEVPPDNFDFFERPLEGNLPTMDSSSNSKLAESAEIDDDEYEQKYGHPRAWEGEAPVVESPQTLELSIVERHEAEEAFGEGEVKLENFASLTDLEQKLKKIEAENITVGGLVNEDIEAARLDVVLAIKHVYLSRFSLGKALSVYRVHFKADRVWMEVANAIADEMHLSEKTVRNIVSDFEQLSAACLHRNRGGRVAWD